MTDEVRKPVLSDLTISLAFQFQAFSVKNPELYEQVLNENYRQIVKSIVQTYDPPADVLRGQGPHVRRGRSQSVNSVSPSETTRSEKPLTYPLSWNHGSGSTSALVGAVTTFTRGVRYYTDTDHFLTWQAGTTRLEPENTSVPENLSPDSRGHTDASPESLPSPFLKATRSSRLDNRTPLPKLDKGKGRRFTSLSLSPPVTLTRRTRSLHRSQSPPSFSSLSDSTSEVNPAPRKPSAPDPQDPYTATDLVNRILFPPGQATFDKMSGNGNEGYRNFTSAGFSGNGPNRPAFGQPGASNSGNTAPGSNPSGNQLPQGQGSPQQMPPPPTGVDPIMWQTMLQAMQATVRNLQPTPGTTGPMGPQGLPGPPGQAASGGSGGGFRASDLGFFHPDLEESYGIGDIIFSSKETIYREVYSFCRRVEDYAVIKGEDVVRANLSTCFRGAALSWWLNTLSQDEKDAMMQLQTGLRRTLTRLQDRFKISMSSALDQLTRQVYTLGDAGSRRDPASYVQSVSKYAVQAGISEEHAQATWAWNHLEVELQATIPPPTSQTTLREFTEELDNRKELWHRLNQQKESQHKDVRKEVRDRDRERDRDRDREQRSNKDRSLPRERQGGFQEAQERPFLPSRPFMTGPRAYDARSYQPRPLYPGYGYQQQPNFPMYPSYASQAYTPYQQNQGGQAPSYMQPPGQQFPQAPPQAQAQAQAPATAPGNQAPRNALPAPKQPLMITAGNAQPNQSQYPNRTNYQNRGGRPFYPARQYGGNQGYGGQGFAGMPMPQPPQEAYFHDLGNESFISEGYHGDYDPTYSQDSSVYHASNDDHFHDAHENKASEDEKSDYKDEEVDVGFVSIAYHVTTSKMGDSPVCRKCQKEFSSNNQLHAHLKEKSCRRTAPSKNTGKIPREKNPMLDLPLEESIQTSKKMLLEKASVPEKLELIESAAPANPNNGMTFRSWHYLTGLFSLSLEAPPESGCLDTGCPMSMGDRVFLKRLVPSFSTKKHTAPITLRGIGSNRHSTDEWITLSFFMKGETPEGKPVMIKFTRDIHVVDNLKANLLIGMDILGPEGVVIDLPQEKVILTKCGNVAVPVQATARDNVRIRRIVRSERHQVIPPKSTGSIAVSLRGKDPLPDRDFLFEPEMNGVLCTSHRRKFQLCFYSK